MMTVKKSSFTFSISGRSALKILLRVGRVNLIAFQPISPQTHHTEIPMPTYDYQCQTCGHQFEARQSMKDPHLTDCPKEDCTGPVKRLIGAGSGFIFKGSGFYITDYRSDSYKAAAKSDSAASASSTSTSTPAPAPAPKPAAPAPAP
jgi:putative FmdB family regulatory protein